MKIKESSSIKQSIIKFNLYLYACLGVFCTDINDLYLFFFLLFISCSFLCQYSLNCVSGVTIKRPSGLILMVASMYTLKRSRFSTRLLTFSWASELRRISSGGQPGMRQLSGSLSAQSKWTRANWFCKRIDWSLTYKGRLKMRRSCFLRVSLGSASRLWFVFESKTRTHFATFLGKPVLWTLNLTRRISPSGSLVPSLRIWLSGLTFFQHRVESVIRLTKIGCWILSIEANYWTSNSEQAASSSKNIFSTNLHGYGSTNILLYLFRPK